MSVNDAFVMDAWGKASNADGKVRMLADYQGALRVGSPGEVVSPGEGANAGGGGKAGMEG